MLQLIDRLRGCGMVVACVAGVGAMAGPIWAQPRLGPGTLDVANPTPAQTQALDAYTKHFVDELIEGRSGASVVDARERLLEPVRNIITSPIVRELYSQSAARELRRATSSSKVHVRLNALIVASELPTGEIAELAAKGLADENPAARYWAAKSVAEVVQRAGTVVDQPPFTQSQQRTLLGAIQKAMPGESSPMVLEQMYRALASLNISEAHEALTGELDKRLARHNQTLDESLRADLAGLTSLRHRLVVADAQGANVDVAVRRLAAVSGRYLRVTATQLQAGQLPAGLIPVAMDVVKVAEEAFELAAKRFDPGLGSRPALLDPAQSGQYDMLLLNVWEWVGKDSPGLLSRSKIAIPAEQLKLP